MGRRVAPARTSLALQAEQVALTQLRETDPAQTYPIRDTVTHPWSWRLLKTCFAPQQTARSCHANLICGWMRSLYHLKRIQRILPIFFFVCVYCSFSSWWSDKFLELSRNLLTSNIFNNLFIHFQVCLAIALFPFSCFSIHLPFQMSLLYCDDFQWLKFPYFLFLLEINYHLLKWQCLHGFCVFLLDPLFLCMREIFSLDSPNLSKDPFFQDHFEINFCDLNYCHSLHRKPCWEESAWPEPRNSRYLASLLSLLSTDKQYLDLGVRIRLCNLLLVY